MAGAASGRADASSRTAAGGGSSRISRWPDGPGYFAAVGIRSSLAPSRWRCGQYFEADYARAAAPRINGRRGGR